MGLACKDNLDRPLRMVQDTSEPLRISEDQSCTLISSKAASKADDEGVGIEHTLELSHLDRPFTQAEMLPK